MMTYLYILGYGRSGSTLLDWLLDSHPACLGLGEAGRLPGLFLDDRGASRKCGCGSLLRECPLWGSVAAHALSASPHDLKFDPWNLKLLELISSFKKGATVLVDSSCWLPRLRQILEGKLSEACRVRILLLTRDARGVVYSASVRGYRKGAWRPSALRAAAGWWWRNRRNLSLIRGLPRESWMHVSYERLCADPGAALGAIQEFIGIEPLGLVDDWRVLTHHTIAGNVGLRQNRSPLIRQDLEWTGRLRVAASLVTELITGRLNRTFLAGLEGAGGPEQGGHEGIDKAPDRG